MAYDFNKIVRTYDQLNRVISLGLDRRWRRTAAAAVCKSKAVNLWGGEVLDVACGTGDMTKALLDTSNKLHVRGCDISLEMIAEAKRKITHGDFELGDAESLPYPDGIFSAVTCAFGVRNFVHLERGLRELLRVLRPSGKLVILEFATPDSPLVRPLYRCYSRKVIPWLGKVVAGNREAYTYLTQSIERFPKGKAFTALLEAMECTVEEHKLTLGVCRLYVAEKRD